VHQWSVETSFPARAPAFSRAWRGRARPRAHGDDFGVTAALAGESTQEAPARRADAQVQSLRSQYHYRTLRVRECVFADPTTFGAPGVYPGYTLARQVVDSAGHVKTQ